MIFFAYFRNYTESERGNGAIFTCAGFGIAIIWWNNSVFVFDSHSRNADGYCSGKENCLNFIATTFQILLICFVNVPMCAFLLRSNLLSCSSIILSSRFLLRIEHFKQLGFVSQV